MRSVLIISFKATEMIVIEGRADTICALATSAGGAIGIIRVSGKDAIEITDRIFRSSGRPLTEARAWTVHYGNIMDGDGGLIDDVLVSVFRAPHSYTGEDCTEISCHGSRYILRKVLERLIDEGCRQAEPGEYTQRAFLNGKMDLSQAEAVADLIASTNRATHKMAVGQLRGNLSSELASLRERLLRMTSLLELELDFSDQDVDFADRQQLLELARVIDDKIMSLAKSFEAGRAIKQGIPVAIVGKTNVGKSTLLNRLIGEDKAIVSNIHGTTRDVIEDCIEINGVTFRFIDTAGIRMTDNEIERIGIRRTYKKLEEASIVLWLMDGIPSEADLRDIARMTEGKRLIVVRNKIDEQNSESYSKTIDDSTLVYSRGAMSYDSLSVVDDCGLIVLKWLPEAQYIRISAKEDVNIKSLERAIFQSADIPDFGENNVIITNVRHYEALCRAHKSILLVIAGLQQNISGDLLSEDLRLCISRLGEIVGGAIVTEETLQSIFRDFCIGK